MPVGNLDWGPIGRSKKSQLDKLKRKSDALGNPVEHEGITDAGNVPPAAKMPTGKPSTGFASIKAYYTRSRRSLYSKK